MGYDKAGIRLAMDRAQQHVVKAVAEFRQARHDVSTSMPHLALDHAKDAPAVYAVALRAAGVDLNGVARDAYRHLFDMLKSGRGRAPGLAMDAAAVKGFNARFPNVARIGKA